MHPINKTLLFILSFYAMFLLHDGTAIANDFSINTPSGVYSTDQNIQIIPATSDIDIYLSCGNNSFAGSSSIPFALTLTVPNEIVTGHPSTFILKSSPTSGSANLITDYDIRWSVSSGNITGTGTQVIYSAPAIETPVLITVMIDDRHGTIISLGECLFVHKQVIILKADDYWISTDPQINKSWADFIEYIETNNLKASIGLIGNTILNMDQNALSEKKNMLQRGNIEFFDHGYDHGNGTYPDGSHWWEFWNTPQAQQQDHLTRFINLAKTKLNLDLHTFGAPGNAFDESASSLLNSLPEFKIFYYLNAPPLNSNKLLLKITSLEHNVPNFISIYDGNTPYIVYQVHPYTWDQTALNEFIQIIGQLQSKDVRFMTSYDYFLNYHDSILHTATGDKWMKYSTPVKIENSSNLPVISTSRSTGLSSSAVYNYIINRPTPTPTTTTTPAPAPTILLPQHSGTIIAGGTTPTISDALAVLRHIVGLSILDTNQLVQVDVAPLNLDGTPLGNGVVDIADVIIILRSAVGLLNW